MNNNNPIITIDGPTASGKGTVAQQVAANLQYHYLDSGALYRIVALASLQQQIDWQDAKAIAELAQSLDIRFSDQAILVNDTEVTLAIRTEQIAQGASTVAVHPEVRTALVALQHNFCQSPGLVADGRDMGTVIFPQASTKIFLVASTEIRAKRRFEQLKKRPNNQNIAYENILAELLKRDERDKNRSSAPLVAAADAITVDTDKLSIEQAVRKILLIHQEKQQNSFTFQ